MLRIYESPRCQIGYPSLFFVLFKITSQRERARNVTNNHDIIHHLEDALGFQEELLTELTKRAQMSEKTADRALAEQFARSKPNFCTLLLSSASPRSLLGLKMPASIKIGYLPSYTASNLVSMEGFCILWAGKLVIGSAVSSCAKCRQETKM